MTLLPPLAKCSVVHEVSKCSCYYIRKSFGVQFHVSFRLHVEINVLKIFLILLSNVKYIFPNDNLNFACRFKEQSFSAWKQMITVTFLLRGAILTIAFSLRKYKQKWRTEIEKNI